MDAHIPNYLSKLSSHHRDFHIYEHCDIIPNLFQKGMNRFGRKKLSNLLEISDRAIYYYMRGQKRPSIKLILKLVHILDAKEVVKKLYDNFIIVSTASHSGQSLPRFYSSELSYLTGIIAGDGTIPKGTTISITNSSEAYLSEIISPLVENLFGVHSVVFSERNHFRLDIYSSSVHFFFTEVINLPLGKKKGRLEMPCFIYLKDEYKIQFLKGLFDTDGGLTKSRKGAISILYSSSTKIFLQQVQSLLKEKGISLPGPYLSGNKKGLEIRSFKKTEIDKFYNTIGSSHPERSERLSALVA
jgi:hypothetical protein